MRKFRGSLIFGLSKALIAHSVPLFLEAVSRRRSVGVARSNHREGGRMNSYMFSDEQQGSFAKALAEAGARHGDTVEVAIVAGVLPHEDGKRGTHLAYCPSRMRVLRTLQVGTPEERGQPIAGAVEYDQPQVLAKKLNRYRGMVYFTAIVHTNGHIAVALKPESVRRVNVRASEWQLRSTEGRDLAVQALAQA